MLNIIRESHRVEIKNLMAKFKGVLKDIIALKLEEVKEKF